MTNRHKTATLFTAHPLLTRSPGAVRDGFSPRWQESEPQPINRRRTVICFGRSIVQGRIAFVPCSFPAQYLTPKPHDKGVFNGFYPRRFGGHVALIPFGREPENIQCQTGLIQQEMTYGSPSLSGTRSTCRRLSAWSDSDKVLISGSKTSPNRKKLSPLAQPLAIAPRPIKPRPENPVAAALHTKPARRSSISSASATPG